MRLYKKGEMFRTFRDFPAAILAKRPTLRTVEDAGPYEVIEDRAIVDTTSHLPRGGKQEVICNLTATNIPCRDRRPRRSVVLRKGDSRRLRHIARDIGEMNGISGGTPQAARIRPYMGCRLPYGCRQPNASLV